jgi:biotin--protein ligase
MLNKIALYNGEGVSETFQNRLTSLFPDCILLSANDLINGDWDRTATLLILPGGRDIPYHQDLKGPGNRKIRSFVENGGTYLGLCAGAYYASALVDFERGTPLEVIQPRELRFFQGRAVGPAYGLGLFDYGSERGARDALISFNGRTYPVYFNGGPTFEGDFTNTKILATYQDLPGTPPAILSCAVGRGKAILSGVHLETNPELLRHLTENAAADEVEVKMEDCLT